MAALASNPVAISGSALERVQGKERVHASPIADEDESKRYE